KENERLKAHTDELEAAADHHQPAADDTTADTPAAALPLAEALRILIGFHKGLPRDGMFNKRLGYHEISFETIRHKVLPQLDSGLVDLDDFKYLWKGSSSKDIQNLFPFLRDTIRAIEEWEVPLDKRDVD